MTATRITAAAKNIMHLLPLEPASGWQYCVGAELPASVPKGAQSWGGAFRRFTNSNWVGKMLPRDCGSLLYRYPDPDFEIPEPEQTDKPPSAFCADRRTEALFCLALLPEGTDCVERVTTRFIQHRDNMTPELLRLIDGKD